MKFLKSQQKQLSNPIIHIAFLWAAHAFDAAVTGIGLSMDSQFELNPLLSNMYAISPISFFLTKLLLVLQGTGIAIHHWNDKRMRYAIYVVNVLMALLVIYEVYNMSLLGNKI